jgi:hypothetical protein
MRSETEGLKGGKNFDLGGNVSSSEGFRKVEMCGLILTERCTNPKHVSQYCGQFLVCIELCIISE